MHNILTFADLETPIGLMRAVASDQALIFVDFCDRPGFDKAFQRYGAHAVAQAAPHALLGRLKDELHGYFQGHRRVFTVPRQAQGTSFQQHVWQQLCAVPYGTTRSYRDHAEALGRPTAYRAVARANATNPCVILVPCHRIIAHDGSLGGYGGGLFRKQWLLAHEAAKGGQSG